MSDDAEKILSGLNDEQREVVLHDKGPCIVTACAGAGKTAAVVRRMAYLVKVRGVEPARIFGTTFSRDAAREMNVRIKDLLGEDTTVQIQTLHAFCRRVLAEEMEGFKDWKLDETERYRELVKRAAGFEHVDWKRSDVEELVQFIELAKSAALDPDSEGAMKMARERFDSRPVPERNPELIIQVYTVAEKLRKDMKLMTFDDWLVETNRVFSTNEAARQRWASLFQYVIIDEAQDNSAVQAMIADQIARDHRNLMIIGDEKQSIYGWRGAFTRFFTEFPAKWNAKVITMFKNYRSTKSVIESANVILKSMDRSAIVSDREMEGSREEAGEVLIDQYDTKELEAHGIMNTMIAMNQDGVSWDDFVVLYRVNALSRAIEEAMAETKVPYRVVGSTCFYTRKEVTGLLSYLRVVWRKGATMDDVKRCLFNPQRFLGKVFMGHVEQAGAERPQSFSALVDRAIQLSARITGQQKTKAQMWATLIDRLRADVAEKNEYSNPGLMLEKIVQATNYNEWLREDEGHESPDNDRVSNVAELIRAARTFGTIGQFLEHVNGQIAASKKLREDQSKNRVTLMSIHRAKGLEWPHVFLISCNEGVIPHVYAEDFEEERRLFYVAATRARDTLHISHVGMSVSKGQERDLEMSRYLAPLAVGARKPGEVPEMEFPDQDPDGLDLEEVAQVIPLFGRKEAAGSEDE